MEEFLDVMEKDYLKEHFTKEEAIIYGVCAPLILTVLLFIMSILEQMSKTTFINP